MSPPTKSYREMDPRLLQAIETKLADALVGEANERAQLQRQLNDLQNRVGSVETAVDALGDEVRDNTKLTKDIHENTKEMLGIFQTAKGGFKVVGWFGTALKWTGGAVGGLAAIWAAIWAIVQNVKGGH